MLSRLLLAYSFLVVSAMAADVKNQCYSLDGQVLDTRFQPCNPGAQFSSCCALNGTDGQNDICLDSGLCMSTSGWFSTYLWANGCTDPTGKDKSCSQQCSFMGSGYSWNVLQCDANNGTFCCRAASDENNCCTTEAHIFTADNTIGQLLLPGTDAVVNTTYSTIEPKSSSDHSGIVGGVVGGVLGALLLATLLALFMVLRSRKSLRNNYSSLQQEHDTALQHNSNEKSALQAELEQHRANYQQYQAQAPIYSPPQQQHYPAYYQASPALPMATPPMEHGYANEVSGKTRPVELDGLRGASELSEESSIPHKVDTLTQTPKRSD